MTRRLPNGKKTESLTAYHLAWSALGLGVNRVMPEWHLISFDPMVVFQGPNDEVVTISPRFAQDMIAAFDG